MERVRDRARAVVAGVLEAAVPAAVLVRLGGDAVGGGDGVLDLLRRARSARAPCGRRRTRTASLAVDLARRARPRRASPPAAGRPSPRRGRVMPRPLLARDAPVGADLLLSARTERTLRRVLRPKWPSAVALEAEVASAFDWSDADVERRVSPVRSGRSPRAASAEVAGTASETATRGRGRQTAPQGTVGNVGSFLVFSDAYGVSCRARAEKCATPAWTPAIRPRAPHARRASVPPPAGPGGPAARPCVSTHNTIRAGCSAPTSALLTT